MKTIKRQTAVCGCMATVHYWRLGLWPRLYAGCVFDDSATEGTICGIVMLYINMNLTFILTFKVLLCNDKDDEW